MTNNYKWTFGLFIFFVSSAQASALKVCDDALSLQQHTGAAEYNYKSLDAQAREIRLLSVAQLNWQLRGGYNDHSTKTDLANIDAQTTEASASISVRQPLFDRELKYGVKAAEKNAEIGMLQIIQEEQDVILKSVSAYLDLQLQQQLLMVAKKKYSHLQKELQRVHKLVDEGFIAHIDEKEVLMEIERTRLELGNAEKNVGISKSALQQLTGKYYNEPSKLLQFERIKPSLFDIHGKDELIKTLNDNLKLKTIALQSDAANQLSRSSKGAALPKLSLVGEYSYRHSRDDDNVDSDIENYSIGLQLSQSLSILGNSNRQRAQSQKYRSWAQQRQKNALRYELESQLNQLFVSTKSGLKSFKTLKSLLQHSQNKIKLVQQAQTLGRRNQRDVYDAIVQNYSIHESLVNQFYQLILHRLAVYYQAKKLNRNEIKYIDELLAKL